jgi:iron complex outermembrane receptor protein
MKKKLILGLWSFALLFSLRLAAQTTAAPADEKKKEEVLNLPTFQVSKARDVGYFSAETTAGSRVTQAIVDVPGSISVINSEMLSDLNVVDPDDALKYGTSGVTSNEHVRDDMTIRGFRQQQIFRDGVQSTSFVINQMYDVDRLEVIKGPAAMTFGNSGVLGGVVNFVAKKPTYTPQGDVKVTVASEGNYVRGVANVSGPLSAERKDIRYRLTVGGQNDDMVKSTEHNDQTFLGGAVDFDLGKTTISLYGYYADLDRYAYFNDFLDASITSGVMQMNKYSTPEFVPANTSQNLYFDSKELYFTGTMLTQLSENFTFRGFYRYRSEDEPRRIIRGITMQADNVHLNRQFLDFPYSEFGHTAQVDFLYKLKLKYVDQDISFGADYSKVFSRDQLGLMAITALDTANPDYTADAALPEHLPYNNQDTRTNSESLSFYVQDYAKFWDERINLVAGLRWINPYQSQQNFLTNTTAVTDKDLQNIYRYGIVVKPRRNISVYAMTADTFQFNSGVNHLGVPLLDSDGKITEFGLKAFDLPFAGGNFFLSGAYFDMELTNVRTIGPLTVVNGQTVNEILQTAGDTSKGWEFDLGYRRKFGPGEAEVMINYYDAKSMSATGIRSVRTPENVYSFFLKYAFTEGGLKGLSAGFGGYYEGDKLATTNGLLYYDFDDTYDAFVQYRLNRNWTFAVNGSNLTDARYVASYAAVGLVGGNAPRTFSFTVKYGW